MVEQSLGQTNEVRAEFLKSAIKEYQTKPLTPELVDEVFRVLWKTWGERIGHSFTVPACDRTEEQLNTLKAEGRGVLLIPDEIYTKKGLDLLSKMFSEIRLSLGWVTVNNSYNYGGCIDVEIGGVTPYKDGKAKGLTTQELRETLNSEGKKGQRLATYIIGSQFNKLLTGHYFDEEKTSWVRLLGTEIIQHFHLSPDLVGGVPNAKFAPDGKLWVGFHDNPEDHNKKSGGRSEKMKEQKRVSALQKLVQKIHRAL